MTFESGKIGALTN